MNNKKILVLYSCLSDYILNILTIYTNVSEVKIHMVYINPIKKEAPFEFDLKKTKINFHDYDNFNVVELIELTKIINPDLIICGGWNNKKYNKLINIFNTKIKCILVMDNQWIGTPKQYLGLIYSRIFIVKKYAKIWVSGRPQMKYALKLGFKKNNILEGWYVANIDKFKLTHNRQKIEKRFVFVGRYVENKGILDLLNAFIKLVEEVPNDWILTCIGTGILKEKIKHHPRIEHIGFLQPEGLQEFSKKGGVFVLPSHFEPWGLVVQEFALAAFPLLVSDKVGSASQFVKDDNGIIFNANSVNSLFTTLKTIVQMNECELIKMSNLSKELGGKISYENWINILNTELSLNQIKK